MVTSSKYMDIVNWTIEKISSGTLKQGDKLPSEAELGNKFGFSRQTVRRALDVLEQKGHITRIQGSGTYVSTSARRRRNVPGNSSMTVGVVSSHFDDYIFPGIIRGIEEVFSADGFSVQLASTKNSLSGEARALKLMLESRPDGLIVWPTKSGFPCFNLELFRLISERGIAVVFIDSYYQELSLPYVALDDEAAGYMATQYLLEKGHKDIMCILSHSHRQGHLRYLGYAKALNDAGYEIRDELVHWYSRENIHQILNGYLLWESLHSSTAALCFNDQLALTLISLLAERGKKVPEDISVMGIDDSETARVNALTSIVHPGERLGKSAAELLLSMINGYEGKKIIFPPRLAERSSVKRLEE